MSLFALDMLQMAEELLQQMRAKKLKLATAESCTGGLVSALLTEISGSSSVFTHGYITYANEAKTQMLGVPESLLDLVGAVSEQVAVAMAEGALKHSGADVAVSLTGIAGPSGETPNKPVGLVHIASVRSGYATLHEWRQFAGDRAAVRLQATILALELIGQQVSN